MSDLSAISDDDLVRMLGMPAPAASPQPAVAVPSAPSPASSLSDADLMAAISQPTQAAEGPGRGRSALLGAFQGATFNFGDEIASGINAGIDYVTGQAPKGLGEAYDSRLAAARAQMAEAEKANPGTFLAGQIGGGVLTLPFTPAKAGIAGGAATGAAYGALSGAGAGEGIGGRATGAAVGGTIGAGVGAVAPVVIGGAQTLYGKAKDAVAGATGVVRGAINPEAEAARRVQNAISRDASIGGQQFDDAALARAQAAGQPVAVADMGGETTRALARSAANTSPEGRAALQGAVDDRFETQAPRVTEFVQRLVGTSGDAGATRESLEAAARLANRAAYGKAYAQGAANVWDDTLATFAQAPAVQAEIRDATRRSANKAASQGFAPPRNPFIVAEDGSLSLQPGVTPSLQFWDVVKQGLDDQINKLQRSGAGGEAGDLIGLRNGLRSHLDTLVPSYAAARKGAAQAFDAENALEAGQKFVISNMANNDARRAFAKMSMPERRMFAEGFASSLIEQVSKAGDRRNLVNSIYGTPRARERIEIALGREKAREVEAFLRVESTMDLLRNAVSGNSNTARQLIEIGLAGGGATTAWNGDPATGAKLLLVAALSKGQRAIDGRVAQKVAEMLVSTNPDTVRKAAQMIGRDKTLMEAIKSANDYVAKITGPAANENVARPLEMTVRPMFQGSRAASGSEGQQEDQGSRYP